MYLLQNRACLNLSISVLLGARRGLESDRMLKNCIIYVSNSFRAFFLEANHRSGNNISQFLEPKIQLELKSHVCSLLQVTEVMMHIILATMRVKLACSVVSPHYHLFLARFRQHRALCNHPGNTSQLTSAKTISMAIFWGI